MSELSQEDQELLERVREATDSPAVVTFIELAMKEEPDLNMLLSLRRYAENDGVETMGQLGNEVEKAIWNEGLNGMQKLLRRADPDDSYLGEPYGANPDETQQRLLEETVSRYLD